MPSQLTSKLYTGAATNLNDFALHCARDLSLFFELRDEPTEPALPPSFTPRSFYGEQVEKIESEIKTVDSWGDREATQRAEAFFQEQTQEYEVALETTAERRQRYEQMHEDVEAWQPPTSEHEHLKEHMLKLLAQDMPFACTALVPQPQQMTGRQYKQVRLETLRMQLAHAVKDRDGDIERNRVRTNWTDELRQSLPDDPRTIGN